MSEDPDRVLRQIAERVLKRRTDLGLRQQDLAELLGITPTNIHRIEHAQQNLTIRTLCKLADALGVTLGELLMGTPPPAAGKRERSR